MYLWEMQTIRNCPTACERLPQLQERYGGNEECMQVNMTKYIGKKT